MFDKKELLINTHKLNNSGDYFSLWEQLAKKFTFIRYNFNDFDSKISDEDIIKQTNQKFKKSIHYCSTSDTNIEPNFKIIWKSSNEYVLINKKWELGATFVIPDYSTPYRYFIGFEFKSGYISHKIAGMIIYFDSDGNLLNSKTKIMSRSLVNDYDIRNGCISHDKSAFYKQTLIFTQSHRDTGKLLIFVNLLDFDDNIEANSFYYTQQITTSSIWNNYRVIDKIHEYPRFFHLTGYLDNLNTGTDKDTVNKIKTNILIDLGSLKLLKDHVKELVQTDKSVYKFDQSEYLKFDYYISTNINNDNNVNDIEDFFQKANYYEQEEYSDGYPEKCVICNKKTFIATYCYKNLLMGLGNSFCLGCEIRYSKSDKVWKCCKCCKYYYNYNNSEKEKSSDNVSIHLCSNILSNTNGYQCVNTKHQDGLKLSISGINKSNNLLEIIKDTIYNYTDIFSKKEINVYPLEI